MAVIEPVEIFLQPANGRITSAVRDRHAGIHSASEPLYEGTTGRLDATIRNDLHATPGQHASEDLGDELVSLIGIEDIRSPITELPGISFSAFTQSRATEWTRQLCSSNDVEALFLPSIVSALSFQSSPCSRWLRIPASEL